MTRNIMTVLLFLLAGGAASAQEAAVTQEEMAGIYERVRTPYKYGMVVAPDANDRKFDCPTVFRSGGTWLMTYVCYDGAGGTDGRGYETWLAKSDDLLHWETLGRILAFGDGGWDMNQRGGFPALVDMDWDGDHEIHKYRGSYWMTYIGGEGTGYEAVNAPLDIGLASTSGDITQAHQWTTYPKPILSHNERKAQWWEQMTQYKSTVYEVDKDMFGYRFMMYYNAGGKDETHPKGERIGVAFSNDMKKWKRYEGNPIFAHDTDGTITGDAQIVRMGDLWVMFYFSAFNPTRPYHAFNTFAASRDMINWVDWQGEDLITPTKPYDEMFAHKSCVINHEGVVYHFYCAVNNASQRGIALATSKPMGQSEVRFPRPNPTGKRTRISLDEGWTVTHGGKTVTRDIPINLDDYYGALQKEHGNLHGEATFSKSFDAPDLDGKRCFLTLEGVGTYADITLNGESLGRHDIGRTTETIDVTDQVRRGARNDLTILVSHPSGITDMPWVCGGCSSEYGFSEGSQPFGIFRPVTLEVTDEVRVEPFGTHVWNDERMDSVFIETEVRNYGKETAAFTLTSKVTDKGGRQVARVTDEVTLGAGEAATVRQAVRIDDVHPWSPDDPYMYEMGSLIKRGDATTDDLVTPFGIRTASFPLSRNDGDNRFMVNGEPVFINGVCEYEHMFGQSHAFSSEQIRARVKEVKGAGFNAFRDAHQPHNLLYGELMDREGLLWWPQFSAHIWYDTPQFRESFKRHLRQWVKERRNSPSVILWGLQNESTLPADFARECTEIIREMDPTCGSMRLVTTCNGGDGTDWNVVQNWSGTYGGNIENYAEELKRGDQLLNGEYGAWRTLGNHTGEGYTEERQCDILERKLQLAESARDSVCGHFLWPLQSHDNPGRSQPDEALRKVDKVGPFNHKGLLSAWEQPADAYYLYRSRHVPADREPVVYIVPGHYGDSVRVYSNCEGVRLDCGDWSRTLARGEDTSLFRFMAPRLEGDILTATAILGGKDVAEHRVALEGYRSWDERILEPEDGLTYVYRLNCGGDAYTDSFGNTWMQDCTAWSSSWGDRFPGEASPYQASQTYDPALPVSPLFRSSRFGRHDLRFHFPASPGDYRIELYFIEPWYGIGDCEATDCEGMRLFDVAVNGTTRISDLDVWAQARYSNPYKRVVDVRNDGDEIVVDFPRVNASQAIISAIAIASREEGAVPAAVPGGGDPGMWEGFEGDILVQTPDSLLPPRSDNSISVEPEASSGAVTWTYSVGVAKVYALRFRYHNPEAERTLHVSITDANGTVYRDDDVTFVKTPEARTKRRNTSITTGTQTNAGTYVVTLTGEGIDRMLFDSLTIE